MNDKRRFRPSDIGFIWQCPQCERCDFWSYQSLAYDGSPSCDHCDIDMFLVERVYEEEEWRADM